MEKEETVMNYDYIYIVCTCIVLVCTVYGILYYNIVCVINMKQWRINIVYGKMTLYFIV